ncbi:hypothetical protein D9611_004858 [Ephemerocybe angulata]|uniref:tRNA(Ile)-lysidine synthetase n=1 Tax=Ephemerocybe angulata TaxID=980116 RepID=A0A8H5B398_9AGAR|nr:hypothetical protein D9611_004858 [Tulosesus angulatus]
MSAVRAIEPISRGEFSKMLRRARPPPGWGKSIAVANSGGPDSTCLLYLLHEYFSSDGTRPENQRNDSTSNSHQKANPRIVSLTIDHGLQSSSADMAARTARFAESLGVEHSTTKIPWGEGVFPPLPAPGAPFEETARRARYRTLFDEMTRLRANALAAGHHLDDQVETGLMRLRLGSSMLGASGMRYCRRWGMGNVVGGLDWAGVEGMRRWIVRPFLGVSKDRILATCEANRLEYVVDKTNFQPEVTLRNAVRHVVKNGKESAQSLPPKLLQDIETIDAALENLPNFDGNLNSGPERLRAFVQEMGREVEAIEKEVDEITHKGRLPSPIGTFLISKEALEGIKDKPLVQRALVLRILRYVSPNPWGSLKAQAKRRSARLEELARCLTTPMSTSSKPFSMSSQVLWKPVLKRPKVVKGKSKGKVPAGWIASRQPPDLQNAWSVADRDITEPLLQALEARASEGDGGALDILFDCRFRIRIHLDAIPQAVIDALAAGITNLSIRCDKELYYPSVVLRTPKNEVVLNPADNPTPKFPEGIAIAKPVDWVSIEFIRTLGNI